MFASLHLLPSKLDYICHEFVHGVDVVRELLPLVKHDPVCDIGLHEGRLEGKKCASHQFDFMVLINKKERDIDQFNFLGFYLVFLFAQMPQVNLIPLECLQLPQVELMILLKFFLQLSDGPCVALFKRRWNVHFHIGGVVLDGGTLLAFRGRMWFSIRDAEIFKKRHRKLFFFIIFQNK